MTVDKGNIESITASLYAIDYAFKAQSTINPDFQGELLLVQLEADQWSDKETDILLYALQSSQMQQSTTISNMELIKVDSTPNSLAEKLNTAAFQAKGDILIFLTHNTLVDPKFIQPILQKLNTIDINLEETEASYQAMADRVKSFRNSNDTNFHCSECAIQTTGNIGFLTGRQITADKRIADVGIDFRVQKVSNAALTEENFQMKGKFIPTWRENLFLSQNPHLAEIKNASHWNMEFLEAPLPIVRWRGEHMDYKPALVPGPIPAISGSFAAIKKSIFMLFGGLDCAYEQTHHKKYYSFSFIDFSLLLRQVGFESYYDPDIVVTNLLEYSTQTLTTEEKIFATRWQKYLLIDIESNYIARDIHLYYRMECGNAAVLGFTVEAVNILMGLEKYVPLSVGTSDNKRCIRQMTDVELEGHKVELLERLFDLHRKRNEDEILYIHKDPGRYNAEISRAASSPFYIIGRSMYETDTIQPHWVNHIQSHVDEVWVPSQFNVETFRKGGVDEEKLKVLGNAVDVDSFDPSLPRTTFKFKGECYNRSPAPDTTDYFTFLSIMKFEHRKGWKELVQAFAQEFQEHERVQLVFRSNIQRYQERELNEYITSIEEKSYGPPIFFIKDAVPFHKLKELYRFADVVVSTSHGEGWGLPLMEAMAMEIPTIGVNWSGNTEFMTSENSFLIDVEELTGEGTPHNGHQWANLDIGKIRQQLRYAYSNAEERKKRAVKAREDVSAKWSTNEVARRMAFMIKTIQDDKYFYQKLKDLRNIVHLNSLPDTSSPEQNPALQEKYNKIFYNMKIK